jgi:hypothetical protein
MELPPSSSYSQPAAGLLNSISSQTTLTSPAEFPSKISATIKSRKSHDQQPTSATSSDERI